MNDGKFNSINFYGEDFKLIFKLKTEIICGLCSIKVS